MKKRTIQNGLMLAVCLLAASLFAEDEMTPLRKAVTAGNVVEVERLLDGGADVSVADNGGWTSLHVAVCDAGWLEVVKLLLDHGADVTATNKYGMTPLHMATYYDVGSAEIVKLLLDHGASVDAKDNDNSTPLRRAAQNGKNEIVKLLLNYGANIETTDQYGNTLLHTAAEGGHTKVVALLLDCGANNRARNKACGNRDGELPLHKAADAGNSELVKLLLEHGAESDINDNVYTGSPLYNACSSGNLETVRVLLERGATRSMDMKCGMSSLTPFEHSLDGRDFEVAKLLLSYGADINGKKGAFSTPLHRAASNKDDSDIVKFLMSQGADVDAKDISGVTPLMGAVRYKNVECAQVLLNYGATINDAIRTEASESGGDIFKVISEAPPTSKRIPLKKLLDKQPLEDESVVLKLSDALLEAEAEKLPTYLLQNPGSDIKLLVEVKKRLRDAQMEITKCKNKAQELKEAGQNDEASKLIDLSAAIQGYQASLMSIKSALENY
jgi:ankyrin repeat protein